MIAWITASGSRLAVRASQRQAEGASLTNSNKSLLDRPVFAVAFLSPPSICPSKYYSSLCCREKEAIQCDPLRFAIGFWFFVCFVSSKTPPALVYPRPSLSFATASISCHQNHTSGSPYTHTLAIEYNNIYFRRLVVYAPLKLPRCNTSYRLLYVRYRSFKISWLT